PYFIDKIAEYIEENVLSDEEKEFNLSILYGNDVNADVIKNTAKRYPMFSDHQVVIVKEAQNVKNIENLEDYCNSPLPSTILVLAYKYKKLDKRKSFAKTIEKKAVLFDSQKLYENQVETWLKKIVSTQKHKIDDKSVKLLIEFLGNDLEKISNELDKLFVNVRQDSSITPDLIAKYVGINKDYNVFELKNALITKDVLKANKIVDYFGKNPKEYSIFGVIPVLYGFFIKLLMFKYYSVKVDYNTLLSILQARADWQIDEYRRANYDIPKLTRIIGYLREYNMKALGVDSNTTNTAEGDLMKELIFKILH
ncbi:MAG: DNA polymerase III subunit delta, partial [Bacteroidales bacterium]|nr:DNA polymerase III subunit delta [Bacteroidales bacterium]